MVEDRSEEPMLTHCFQTGEEKTGNAGNASINPGMEAGKHSSISS